MTRDVLERIESPEMRLALMELDRENGVDVGDGLSSADRLAGTSMPSAVVAMLNPMLAPVRGRARVVAAERAVAMPQRLRPRRPPMAVVVASAQARAMLPRLQPRARTPLASARFSNPSSRIAAVA